MRLCPGGGAGKDKPVLCGLYNSVAGRDPPGDNIINWIHITKRKDQHAYILGKPSGKYEIIWESFPKWGEKKMWPTNFAILDQL